MSETPIDSDLSHETAVQNKEAEFHLTDDDIKTLMDAVQAEDSDTVHACLDDLSAADIAELLAKISAEDRQELLSMYGEWMSPLVFAEMDAELARITLSAMPVSQVARLIADLESDDALGLLIHLEEDLQHQIIRKLSAKMRVAVQEGLSFPEESAGRLMQREVVAVPQFWTVGKTVDYLREAAEDLPEDFFDIFVISPAYQVEGKIPLNRLVRARRSDKLESLIDEKPQTIPADMDQEDVAHIFRRDNIASAPVTDSGGRLIGVITIDDIVDVIDEEAQEDLLKLAGVDHGDIYRAVWSTTVPRFRWLFINLLTAILASWVISFFDATIEKIVALAVLMPIVASMGGNAGTQTFTVVIRALATRQISSANMWSIVWKEVLVSTLNGMIFALITGVVAGLWFQSPMLGVVIGMALIVNLLAAGFFGAITPMALQRLGSDPAVSSAVFLTTVTDVVGFLAFLGLAYLLLV